MNRGEKLRLSSAITFLTGPFIGETFPVDKQTVTIGSAASNDIVIGDNASIAAYHARFVWKEYDLSIEKHPRAGKVCVNKRPVEQDILPPNALVELGEGICCLVTFSPTAKLAQGGRRADLGRTECEPRQAQGPGCTRVATFPEESIAVLEVSEDVFLNKKTYPLYKSVINVGRGSQNDIPINHPSVSGQHLQIVRQGDQFILVHPHPERPQTLNGLVYQGRRIRGNEPFRAVLRPGDLIRIGNEQGSFVTLAFNPAGEPREELPPMQPIKLDIDEISIGRLPYNTVVLPHQQVSAYHARLKREGGTYRILDLNSTNHVYVNARRTTNVLLKMGDEIRIGPYKLVFESTHLKQYDESNHIRIDALNLKQFSPNHVTLLDDISLSIAPHKFMAIVGGSGAGKTTLMKALNGLQPANEGSVLYNGQDYYRNLAAFNTQLGYVPQDDIVHRDLTVERALYYAAKMRLPTDFTEEQIQQRISEVLEDVELTGKEKLLVKKLSGGQRKRVSIALELLANPGLFFLDEPTSGLDPGLDRKMMFLLRKLADKGHTIMLVTHATNNISACDYVCFLAQGGRLAYFGPPGEALKYFGAEDFAEIYSNLEPSEGQRTAPQEAAARFKSSQDYRAYIAQPLLEARNGITGASGGQALTGANKIQRPRRGNSWKQYVLLCRRQMELLKNNPSNLAVLLLQAPLVALVFMLLVRIGLGSQIFDPHQMLRCMPQIPAQHILVPNVVPDKTHTIDCQKVVDFLKNDAQGAQYAHAHGGVNRALQEFIQQGAGSAGDAQRVIFPLIFFAILFGCINGTHEIVKEEAIYRRERTVNLGLSPYLLSKITVLGAVAFFQCASLVFIMAAFEPVQHSVFLPPLLELYIPMVLVGMGGVMLGLVISAVAPNEDTANTLMPLIIIPQDMFAGFIVPLKDGFTQTLAAFVPTRWSLAALGSSLGLHTDKLDGGTLFRDDPTYHGTLFSIYSRADAIRRIEMSWAAMVLIILALGMICAIALKCKDTRR